MANKNILPKSTLRNIVNKTYFDINSAFLSNADDLSEYEIQHLFFIALKEQLKNKGCIIKKEQGKVDITIKNELKTYNYWFEIKSFIKKKEYINLQVINKDIEALEKHISKSDDSEKRSFMVIAAKEKTLQHCQKQNKEFVDFLNHKSKTSNLTQKKGTKHHLVSSFVIMHNNSLEKKNNKNQVRLFLIEIKKTKK